MSSLFDALKEDLDESIAYKKSKAKHISFNNNKMLIQLTDNRVISVPINWFPRLENASESERSDYEFIGDGLGIHWESLDEDISVTNLLKGYDAHNSVEIKN